MLDKIRIFIVNEMEKIMIRNNMNQSPKERWIQWQPAQHLIGKYYVQELIFADQNLSLALENDKNEKIKVVFTGSVYAYQSTNESYAYKTIDYLRENYGSSFYAQHTFFTIEESVYLQSLYTPLEIEKRKLVHYLCMPIDALIDIIACHRPTIEQMEG